MFWRQIFKKSQGFLRRLNTGNGEDCVGSRLVYITAVTKETGKTSSFALFSVVINTYFQTEKVPGIQKLIFLVNENYLSGAFIFYEIHYPFIRSTDSTFIHGPGK